MQGGSSMPYSVTKAAQLHLVKCLAVTVGPKIRVNTVLPGLLLTEWVSYSSTSLQPHSFPFQFFSRPSILSRILLAIYQSCCITGQTSLTCLLHYRAGSTQRSVFSKRRMPRCSSTRLSWTIVRMLSYISPRIRV